MAVATLYTLTEGTFLADHGQRHEIDPRDERGLSYFQLGLRAFQHATRRGAIGLGGWGNTAANILDIHTMA